MTDQINIKNYEDWPLKIVYATNGIKPETLLTHLNKYYVDNPEIPLTRRPNFIHVAGSCLIVRLQESMSLHDMDSNTAVPLPIGTYHFAPAEPDLQAICWILDQLQQNATASTHILFSYSSLVNFM